MKVFFLLFALVLPLLATPARAQTLTELAEKEKERRKNAGRAEGSYTDDDLQKIPKQPHSVPAFKPGAAEPDTSASDEARWRARAAARRQAIAIGEARVKRIQSALAAAPESGLRQPQPGDATRQLAPDPVLSQFPRAVLEAMLQSAEHDLQLARKAMDDLEDEARRKRVLPGWLR